MGRSLNQLGIKVRDLPLIHKTHYIFNPNIKKNKTLGVEIEVEGCNLPKQKSLPLHWSIKYDGSLRLNNKADACAFEYVLKTPVAQEYFKKKCFPYLLKKFEDKGAVPEFSSRCSTHIHISVHDLYVYEVILFVGLYYLLEKLFYPILGTNRAGNLFCISANDTEELLDLLLQAAISGDFLDFFSDDLKYTSASLHSIFKLGTVEFRAMEGTLDKERIYKWIDILFCIKNYVKSLKRQEISSLITAFSYDGVIKVLKDIFDNETFEYIVSKNNNDSTKITKKVYEGIRNVQALFYEPVWASIKIQEVAQPTPASDMTAQLKSTAQPFDIANMPPWAAEHTDMELFDMEEPEDNDNTEDLLEDLEDEDHLPG